MKMVNFTIQYTPDQTQLTDMIDDLRVKQDGVQRRLGPSAGHVTAA